MRNQIIAEDGLTAAENAVLAQRSTAQYELVNWMHTLAQWDLYFTGTFRWEASVDSARRTFERWMRRLLPDVSYFYALERNPSRDGHHVHGLFANTAGVYRKSVWHNWFEAYGRNTLEPIRSKGQVEDYCSKYCVKECFRTGWWNVYIAAQPMLSGPDRVVKGKLVPGTL
jgi:hypothetical protein